VTKRRSRGDGGIDQRGQDTFRLRYRVDGKRYTVTFHGTLPDARKELRGLLRNGDTDQHVAPDKVTFADWATQWVKAGAPDGAQIDLSLLKLPDDALMFPSPPAVGESFSFNKLRCPRAVTKEFQDRTEKLGFGRLRLHDLRGTHETLLLDAGVPVHVVAERCGHDPAVLLRNYAKRTRKADDRAAAVIGELSKGSLRG
jgi:integrase